MISCRFGKKIYENAYNGYTVVEYSTLETLKGADTLKKEGGRIYFTAVGAGLPCVSGVDVLLEGTWKKGKYGKSLEVKRYDIRVPKTKEGVFGYLSSGMIKGVGPIIAKRIVDRFGENTLQILEKQPERLLEVSGITERRLDEIINSYQASAGYRELMVFLSPFGVTPKKAERIQNHFGADTIDIVKKDPYRLCEISGFGFLTVDPIAQASQNFSPDAPGRIKAAVVYVLKSAGEEGHLYLEAETVLKRAEELLNKGLDEKQVSMDKIRVCGNELVNTDHVLAAEKVQTPCLENDQIRTKEGYVIYLKPMAEAEKSAAYHMVRLLKHPDSISLCEVERRMEALQQETGIELAEKQKEAVRMVFRSPVSIITGGPGKGKTTTLKFILDIQQTMNETEQVLLCAPTGQARKRMTESTGQPAMTLHKALGINRADDAEELTAMEDNAVSSADMIIVDEFTMADMELSSLLFSRIQNGTRCVFVGDADQLPSIGPGQVFREMIDSGVIPVTVLDIGFRQEFNSRIVKNADNINKGIRSLDCGDDFHFYSAKRPEDAARLIAQIYKKELEECGGDAQQIQVLSPYRVKTETGSDHLNLLLQEIANPSALEKEEWKLPSVVYRNGDKVMQNKNEDTVSNGDVGRIRAIRSIQGKRELEVDFGGSKKVYKEEELNELTLAYACTIHKSQGSEYPVVILPVLPCFMPMLKRNVYYTGITRARKRVYMVGSRWAFYKAVENNDMENRNTLLSGWIVSEAKRQNYAPRIKQAA